MRARVKANSPYPAVRACVGRDFRKDGWTELPDAFLEEARENPLLEIEEVLLVEPDESVRLEQMAPSGPNFDVVLAGNAAAVKGFVSSLQSMPDLESMHAAETKGKARKSVLIAIEDRQIELRDSD